MRLDANQLRLVVIRGRDRLNGLAIYRMNMRNQALDFDRTLVRIHQGPSLETNRGDDLIVRKAGAGDQIAFLIHQQDLCHARALRRP